MAVSSRTGLELDRPPRRIVNGVAVPRRGIPFAIADRSWETNADLSVMGEALRFPFPNSTAAVLHNLPFVAIVGNDACLNPKPNSLRDTAAQRMHAAHYCPTRLPCRHGARRIGR